MTPEAKILLTETARRRLGDEWIFNESNQLLKPSVYPLEIKNIDLAGKPVQDLVRGISDYYVDEGWSFKTLLAKDSSHFVLVYTNSEGAEVFKGTTYEIPLLIKYDERRKMDESNDTYLQSSEINRLLRGTNLMVNNSHAELNAFKAQERVGIIRKTNKFHVYSQTGVAYIVLNLGQVQQRVDGVDNEILILKEQANREMNLKYEERDGLKNQIVQSPVKLF